MDKHIIQEPKIISQIIGKLLAGGDQKIVVNIITIGTIDIHNGNGKKPYMEIMGDLEPMELNEQSHSLLTDDAIKIASSLNKEVPALTMEKAMEKVSGTIKETFADILTPEAIVKALEETGWNQMAAARNMGVNYSTFRNYIVKYQIEKSEGEVML